MMILEPRMQLHWKFQVYGVLTICGARVCAAALQLETKSQDPRGVHLYVYTYVYEYIYMFASVRINKCGICMYLYFCTRAEKEYFRCSSAGIAERNLDTTLSWATSHGSSGCAGSCLLISVPGSEVIVNPRS